MVGRSWVGKRVCRRERVVAVSCVESPASHSARRAFERLPARAKVSAAEMGSYWEVGVLPGGGEG
jgi:hypothetical protein